jgi:hypothetical protein
MEYRKRKINHIIILSILFLFQKSFGSNYLKDVTFYGKENGLIVEFVFEEAVSPDSVNAWQSQTEWFYFTLYNVRADTSELLVQTEIKKPVLNFQPILTEQSTQIGIKLKNRVESFEIFKTREDNTLNAHLHYSIENFADLFVFDVSELYYWSFWSNLSRSKSWLLLIGSGYTITGLLNNKKKNEYRTKNWNRDSCIYLYYT